MHDTTATPNPITFQAFVTREQVSAAIVYFTENKPAIRDRARQCHERGVALLGAYLAYRRQPTSGAGAWLVYQQQLYTQAQGE